MMQKNFRWKIWKKFRCENRTLLSVQGYNVKIARLRNLNIFSWKWRVYHPEYDVRNRFAKIDRFDIRRMCRSFICVPLSFKMKFCHGPWTVYIFIPSPSYRRIDQHGIFIHRIWYPFCVVLSCRTFRVHVYSINSDLFYLMWH